MSSLEWCATELDVFMATNPIELRPKLDWPYAITVDMTSGSGANTQPQSCPGWIIEP